MTRVRAQGDMIDAMRTQEKRIGVVERYADDIADLYANFRGMFFDVTDNKYGALGDGATDDQPAIQSALNAAKGGGIVFLPRGKYLLGATITVPSGVFLIGSGGTKANEDYGTIVTHKTSTYNGNLITLSNSDGFPTNIGFRDFQLWNQSNSGNHGMYVGSGQQATHVYIDNLAYKNYSAGGGCMVRLDPTAGTGCERWRWRNCTWVGGSHPDAHGIYATGGFFDKSNLFGCVFESFEAYAAVLGTTYVRGFGMYGNVVEGTGRATTTITGVNALNSTTVNVGSTTGFLNAGYFSWKQGGTTWLTITYTDKTATSFTGCSAHPATAGGEAVEGLMARGTVYCTAESRGLRFDGCYSENIGDRVGTPAQAGDYYLGASGYCIGKMDAAYMADGSSNVTYHINYPNNVNLGIQCDGCYHANGALNDPNGKVARDKCSF